ncbi:MAG: dipeptide epimerase [Fimbriimonadaceae bacterium]|nr:dipeptide epimerase [Fimbriimonadaceae bacterium]
MEVSFRRIRLTKRRALTISRGTSSGSWNLFVFVSDGEFTGVGECAPGTGMDDTLAALAESQLQEFLSAHPLGDAAPFAVDREAATTSMEPAARAGLDIALWDYWGKRAGLPLYQLFGLPLATVPTSVTLGICAPDVARERTSEILSETGGRALKIKLGSPDGIEHDQAQYEAAREAAQPFDVRLRVDANGGWEPSEAIAMNKWLADRGCDYVEQPLARDREEELHPVFAGRRLPIFLDESIRSSADVVRFGDRCDGINLKLMKTGGLTEAIRLVATARAHGLRTMIGCMGESSVSIGAGAAIGGLFDHIDLDSHLNLNPDPAIGLEFIDGVVRPRSSPGLGVELTEGALAEDATC